MRERLNGLMHGWQAVHMLVLELLLHVVGMLVILRADESLLGRLDERIRWREVCGEVASDSLLGAALAGLFLFTLQMEAGARLAGLGNPAVLDDGRLRLRVVLGVTERVSLQQVRARKRFGANLALVRLLLRVHAHMAAQMVEASIAFGAFAAAVQPLAIESLGLCSRRRLAIRSRRRRLPLIRGGPWFLGRRLAAFVRVAGAVGCRIDVCFAWRWVCHHVWRSMCAQNVRGYPQNAEGWEVGEDGGADFAAS